MNKIMSGILLLSCLLIKPATQNRVSSYPYITGDTLRDFCDVVIDETIQINDINATNIKVGDIIFVKTEYLEVFFKKIHPKIKYPYILLTHNSAASVPGKYASHLKDSKLVAWYGQNIDRKHKKLFAIPVGIANRHWPHGNIEIIKAAQKLNVEKNIFLYINYDSKTNPERNKIFKQLSKLPGAYAPSRKPFEEYIRDLAHSVFVISPPGKGKDCHRTWETLYLGGIPIVIDSSIAELYNNLPVVVVKDWQELNEEMLAKYYDKISSQKYDLKKIYADYWFNELNKKKRVAQTSYLKQIQSTSDSFS